MSQPQRKVIIPYRVFEEYITTDIAFTGFVWHGGESYSYVLPEMTVTADVRVNRGERSICGMRASTRYNMMAVPASAIPRDAIRMYMPRVESLEQASIIQRRSPIPNSTPLPDPIGMANTKFGVKNSRHMVCVGETIESLSKKYAVSIEDLNIINDNNPPLVGHYYNVFPEVYFGVDWRGLGYNNDRSDFGIVYEIESLKDMVLMYLYGKDSKLDRLTQNLVITGGAREQIQNWDEVENLVGKAKESLINGGCLPGSVAIGKKSMISLPQYVKNAIQENAKGLIGLHNDAPDFWSPVHYIGSFTLSMRVNADGQTATVAVYDSKSKSSLSDNKLDSSVNSNTGTLQTTYQRYVWTIRLK